MLSLRSTRPWCLGISRTLRHNVGRIAALQHAKERRDALAVEPARHDVLEPGEIRRAVQRQAVPRDPTRHLHACPARVRALERASGCSWVSTAPRRTIANGDASTDGGDLVVADPDADVAVEGRVDAVVRARVHQGALEGVHVGPDAELVPPQVDNGVEDQLARPVEGDEAAPVGLPGRVHAACRDTFQPR